MALGHAPDRRAWVVDVDMGYGHSRAAFALRDLGGGTVITANNYKGIPAKDRSEWENTRKLYETVSRLKPIPFIGPALFGIMDRVQRIPEFYPRRDLSEPNLQVRGLYRAINRGLGKDLVEAMAKEPMPLVTTFFVPAFAADVHDYPGDIYCITTDADISRAWAPLDPKRSRIKYIASNGRVQERLKLYGVREDHIFLTGFPLPKTLIGGPDAALLKELLMARICNLDPHGIFTRRYANTLRTELGEEHCKPPTKRHPLTVMYSVGGAGAQRHLGVEIMKSLKHRIARREMRFILSAGTRKDVVRFYREAAAELGLGHALGDSLLIPTFDTRVGYFEGFTKLLETTDVLWTKPSELSFYTGVGIAVVMAPPIGSQEVFNQTWLQYVGGGVPQGDPRYTSEWLFDWVDSGGLARLAWNGYAEAPTHGTYRIEDMVLGRRNELPSLPLIV